MIEVKDLTKYYGLFCAVDNISFEIGAGEIVGFVGPNGAGKTTTMKILTGYIAPSAGTAQVAGFDVVENSAAVRARIGYLPETTPLYKNMTVLEFLRFIADIREIPSDIKQKRIYEMLETCDIADMANRPIRELSKGYRQRVGMAQALIHDPDVLILDEPTVGLDPNQVIEFRNLVRNISKEKTVIFSTHILTEVESICSRTIIIDKGRIVLSGTLEEMRAATKLPDVTTFTVEGPSSADLKNMLGEEQVKIKPVSESGKGFYVRLESPGGPEKAHEIYRLIREKGWELRDLHTIKPSLEDVFRRCTVSEAVVK